MQAFAQEDARPYQPDLEGDLMLDYGFSYWSIKQDQLPGRVIGSNAVSLFYSRRFKMNNHFAFHPGIGFSFDKYAFSGQQTWVFDNNAREYSLDTIFVGAILTKNKLVSTYFEVPLEIRYHPLGTEKGEGWFIGVGLVGGLRLSSHTKVKFDTNQNSFKEKNFDSFELKNYRYGVQFRFGFRSIHLYYKTYLSDLFDTSPFIDGRIPQASTIGINISGF